MIFNTAYLPLTHLDIIRKITKYSSQFSCFPGWCLKSGSTNTKRELPTTPPRLLLVRGLSVKISNNLNKSSCHLLWSCWALSSSKHSPSRFVHRSQRFFHFWKHSWNASSGILRSCTSEFSLISLTDSNRPLFSGDFSLGKRKKSASGRSRDYGSCGTSVVSCCVRKSRISTEEFAGALVWWNNQLLPLRKSDPFFLSNAFPSLFVTFR